MIVVLLRDMGIIPVRFPQSQRQVRQSVLRMTPAIGALMFGFELGTGARTFMTGAAPYVALIAALLAGGPLAGVLAGLGFGLGRGLVPIDRRMRQDEERWDAWLRAHGKRTLPVLSAIATSVAAAVTLWL